MIIDPLGVAPIVGDPDAGEAEGNESEIRRPGHLRVAPRISREVLRRRRLARLAVFGVAAISAASMFTLVAFHVFAVQSAFQLNKLDNQLSNEQRQYGLLRDQVATLSSPESIAAAAAKYGMVPSTSPIVLHAPKAARFGSDANLPVPPTTPYAAIADAGP
jgi:cell division protein FtsL